MKFYPLTRSQSRASSINALGSNLPGPGRNLGRLYDWLGQKLEICLGKMLFRMDQGPANVSRKISMLRESKHSKGLTTAFPDSRYVRKLSRYCRKLVSYSRFVLSLGLPKNLLIFDRSGVFETQLQAVDAISAFAIHDPFLNHVFNYHIANDELAWEISNPDSELLLASCRKALVALSPTVTALHDVARQYDGRAGNAGMTLDFLHDSFVPVVSNYLLRVIQLVFPGAGSASNSQQLFYLFRDPDASFIAVRHLAALQRKRPSSSSLSIHFETLDVFQQLGILLIRCALRCPEGIEWPILDDFILGNLYAGHVLIRYIGGILFTCATSYSHLSLNQA